MSIRTHKRLWLSFVYLGVVLGTGAKLYMELQHFDGQLYLERGIAERLAVAPHHSGASIVLNQRNTPADLLLFDNGRTADILEAGGTFDGAIMPWGLRYDGLETIQQFPDKHQIALQDMDGQRTIPISSGELIDTEARSYRVEEIRPWEGLLRHPRGRPLASVVLTDEPNSQGTLRFLPSDRWNMFGGNTAIQFRWHGSESGAIVAASGNRADLEGEARWGVRDGQAIQWIQSMLPGSGIVRQDGSRVSFLHRSPDQDSIAVEIELNGTSRNVIAIANAFHEEQQVYYEAPALARHVIVVHGWEDNRAIVQSFVSAGDSATQRLECGETWAEPHGQFIRLEQLLSSSVPVTPPTEKIYAATIRDNGTLHTLREGLVYTLEDTRIEYVREKVSPEISVHLSMLDEGGKVRSLNPLRRGEARRVNNWLFSLDSTHEPSDESVILTANRKPGGSAFYLGVSMFVMGSVGWAWTAWRRRA